MPALLYVQSLAAASEAALQRSFTEEPPFARLGTSTESYKSRPLQLQSNESLSQFQHLFDQSVDERDDSCDVRDSAAYAVDASAFPKFGAVLHELTTNGITFFSRGGSERLPWIDMWLSFHFDTLYLTPNVA